MKDKKKSFAKFLPWFAGRSGKKNTRRKKNKTYTIRLGKLAFDFFLGFLILTITPVLVYGFVNPSTTPLLWIRWVQSDYQEKLPRGFVHWVSLKDTSPHLVRAVIASEDQKFFQHQGFDWDAIESAFVTNITTSRKLGASTISMQTARNVFLWQSRTWVRKALESWFTILIECFWSKQRILEVYLNVIEWGDGIYGCEDAAQAYFNRSAKSLSSIEAAWLVSVLPSPRRWSIHKPHPGLQVRQARILDLMDQIRLPKI
jgi:monofunctional biosynthetic peptidoglycan transglycosylase